MDGFDELLNWFSDQDWAWWPLLRLRPARDQDIDHRVLLQLSSVFGPLAGIGAVLICSRICGVLPILTSVLVVLVTTVLFYLIYKYSFARCWNRRAARLRPPPED
jgi:hypothetical protein